MARYIDADELKNRIEKERANLLFLGCLATAETIECRVLPLIDKQPTADVTKVICCKDCFYAKPYNAKWQLPIKENELWCSHHEEEKTQWWFCADAIERMVEDGKIH